MQPRFDGHLSGLTALRANRHGALRGEWLPAVTVA
jgi:hypothetical protein